MRAAETVGLGRWREAGCRKGSCGRGIDRETRRRDERCVNVRGRGCFEVKKLVWVVCRGRVAGDELVVKV
jgi:hypothetical protein